MKIISCRLPVIPAKAEIQGKDEPNGAVEKYVRLTGRSIFSLLKPTIPLPQRFK